MSSLELIPSAQLLPTAWNEFRDGPIWTFNPSVLKHGSSLIFAYRFVGADGRRRIGLCRMTDALEVIPGSAVAYSDHIEFERDGRVTGQALTWFADPRLFLLSGRVFIYWNSGWHDPQNSQFIQQIDANTLKPVGPPRELVLEGERRAIEKNWMLFECDGEPFAIYSINPHRILALELDGSGPVMCRDVASTAWIDPTYAPQWGDMRGGTPPQRIGDWFQSFFHSIHVPTSTYVAGVYRFSAAFPFAPTEVPISPLTIHISPDLRDEQERLNKAIGGDVVYPSGAIYGSDHWIVSLGINDRHCAFVRITQDEIASYLRPVESIQRARVP